MTMPEPLTVSLLLLSLLGGALALGRCLALPLEATVLPVVSLALLGLYALALFGRLSWGPPALLVGGLVLGAIVLWRGRKTWRSDLRVLCSPGMILFYVAAVLCWIRLSGEHYFYWDEISTWGLASKSLVGSHELPKPGGAVELVDYPPGTALFHYLVSYFIGFTEGHTYFAHALLTIPALLVPFQALRWKHVAVMASTVIAAYTLVFILTPGFLWLYVDLVLASWWGAIIAISLLNGLSRSALLAAVPPLAALPVLKDIGWWLALLAIATIAAACFLSRLVTADRGGQSPSQQAGLRRALSAAFGALAIAALLLSSVLLTRISWQHYVRTHQAKPTLQLSVSFEQIKRSFSAETATPRDKVTIERFRRALREAQVGDMTRLPLIEATHQRWSLGEVKDVAPRPAPSTVFWFGVLVVVGAVTALVQPGRKEAIQVAVVTVALAAGCTAYLFGHLLSYLYSFGEWEGTRLGSFGRYAGLYFLGWSIPILAALSRASISPTWRGRVALTLLGAAVLGCFRLAPYESATFLTDGVRPMLAERVQLENTVGQLRRTITPHDRVYVIFQGSNGIEHKIVRFEVAPATVNQWCWSFGEPYQPGEPWTCNVTPAELAYLLSDSSLLFLGRTDEQFWRRYGSLFPSAPTSDLLFRIAKVAGGKVALTPVR